MRASRGTSCLRAAVALALAGIVLLLLAGSKDRAALSLPSHAAGEAAKAVDAGRLATLDVVGAAQAALVDVLQGSSRGDAVDSPRAEAELPRMASADAPRGAGPSAASWSSESASPPAAPVHAGGGAAGDGDDGFEEPADGEFASVDAIYNAAVDAAAASAQPSQPSAAALSAAVKAAAEVMTEMEIPPPAHADEPADSQSSELVRATGGSRGDEHGDSGGASLLEKPDASEQVHVCFCWGDAGSGKHQWQPLLVAINSTLANTKNKNRIVFHVVTTEAAAKQLKSTLLADLPAATIEVHFDDKLEQRIANLVTYRTSSGARNVLASPFNFAPFYLDQFLGLHAPGSRSNGRKQKKAGKVPRRLIYLDTDVVVLGDIQDLHAFDLGGYAVGAVQDCSQKFGFYISFKALKAVGLEKPGTTKNSCVFNRGVFLVDIERWREMRITHDIETYMQAYARSKKDLYRFGMSQPPWLLAVHGRYKPLGLEWNCRGLGRDLLSPREYSLLSRSAKSEVKLKKVGQYFYPYVSECSGSANLLHFNGKLKPWKRKDWSQKKVGPKCQTKKSAQRVWVDCSSIWKRYISDKIESYLTETR